MRTTKTKSKSKSKSPSKAATIDRRTKTDRRTHAERRQGIVEVGSERRTSSERRKTNRRRQIDPTTCEREYSAEEIEFMRAMDEYKRTSGRQFPTCSEVLEVVRGLGYVKQLVRSNEVTETVDPPSPTE